MSEDLIPYPRFLQESLRLVVRRVLEQVAEGGLPGAHHLYLSFRTAHEGILAPAHLAQRYPDEMTVVLQHQFWDLVTDDFGFGVTLSFDSRQERIEVPWEALTGFYDPSVEFGLRFEPPPGEPDAAAPRPVPEAADGSEAAGGPEAAAPEEPPRVNVVSFDDFRKKK